MARNPLPQSELNDWSVIFYPSQNSIIINSPSRLSRILWCNGDKSQSHQGVQLSEVGRRVPTLLRRAPRQSPETGHQGQERSLAREDPQSPKTLRSTSRVVVETPRRIDHGGHCDDSEVPRGVVWTSSRALSSLRCGNPTRKGTWPSTQGTARLSRTDTRRTMLGRLTFTGSAVRPTRATGVLQVTSCRPSPPQTDKVIILFTFVIKPGRTGVPSATSTVGGLTLPGTSDWSGGQQNLGTVTSPPRRSVSTTEKPVVDRGYRKPEVPPVTHAPRDPTWTGRNPLSPGTPPLRRPVDLSPGGLSPT